MLNFIKNKFLFIILISVVTLGALILGAMTLYKKEATFFSSDGYIIEAKTKTNKKYYFSANTEYKDNVENKIVFSDVDNNKVTVDPASFVHYSNGDITFLKKGALVNLTELNDNMINYYSITNQSTIKYDNGSYVVSANNKEIKLESFIGRISDNKYIITGKDLSLKIPQSQEVISGEYFEVLFIEDGIAKIDNEKASYQVTAQDTWINVGNNISINLGSGKISYDNDVKMLMSQITISNNENINLDVDDKHNSAGGGGGGGSGSGTGDGDGEGTGEGEGGAGAGDGEGGAGTGDGEGGAGTGDGEGGTGTGEGEGEGGAGEGGTGSGDGEGGSGGTGTGEGVEVTASLQVELIEAVVTSTTINLSLQLNNAKLVKGNLLYYFTNLSTGKREGNSKYIDLVNGTFLISQESLSPSTDYSFTIVEINGDSEKQYFQKTFRTKDLGISLEKIYATSSSLAYKINFDEGTEVTKARVSICEEVKDEEGNVSCKDSAANQIEISKGELGKEAKFENLKSNTTYAVSVDMVWINNAAYSGVYTINRLDTTLKKTPKISGIQVTANSEEVKFDIKLNNINDPDKSIEKYIYNIYLADDITAENLDPVVQYTVAKNDSDNLILNLNEINELRTGVDYRCKIYAQYNDNEMIREVSTDYSSNFLIKSKPKVSFELESATMNKVTGTLKLIDANCTVPFKGRACSSSDNEFTLRYYKASEEENNEKDSSITFSPYDLTSDLVFADLESNTTYFVKVFGNYIDDDGNVHKNVQLGDTFDITTDKSDNIYFEVKGDNKSGKENPDGSVDIVTFDAKLTAPQDSNVMDEISTITLNLYSGRNHNVKDKLIGTYTITERNLIEDFFNNFTITNKLFTDVTGRRLGNLNTLDKLISVTNILADTGTGTNTGTLNSSYTVEVVDVYDSTGKNEITVENPTYVFNLTPEYYLDSRIESNPNETYITATPITKGGLTDEEREIVIDRISKEEFDMLDDKTIVGLSIENSLSSTFVNSAFKYEKVEVEYVIYNNATGNVVLTKTENMWNNYQPKEQRIFLDSINEDDGGNKKFTRGYKYKVGFNMKFVTEDGENPIYTNEKLHKLVSIDRQDPKYKQYISKSDDSGITYKYSFSDVDNAIKEKNFYYLVGDSKDYKKVDDSLEADGAYHTVTLPIGSNSEYSLYYLRKTTDGKGTYVKMSDYKYEKVIEYDNSISYSIVNDNSNILKIKLENNIYNERAYVYKVSICEKKTDTSGEGTDTSVEETCTNPDEIYTRYFLASKLDVMSESTGTFNEDGEEIFNNYKYIGIDYANIHQFMGKTMSIVVSCYYDNGKVGFEEHFKYGMIIKNDETNKYLNTYYKGGATPSSDESDSPMGIYHMRDDSFDGGKSELFIYNHLVNTAGNSNNENIIDIIMKKADDDKDKNDKKEFDLNEHGINYKLDYTDRGITFTNGSSIYRGYNLRVLNNVVLKTTNNEYKFDTIIPSIKVTTNNTINSIKLNIKPFGIYGNKQFNDDKIYVKFYSDEEMTDLIETVESVVKFTSTDTGYTAVINPVELKNLLPETNYYYTISAYVDNKEVRLFDHETFEKNKEYVYLDYKTNTLGKKEILEKIVFSVKPTSYDKDYAKNTLNWNLTFKNDKNFGIRFELYRPDGTVVETDPETGESFEKTIFKAVNFNGVDAGTCNVKDYGSSDKDGYVKGCYINVAKASELTKGGYNYTFTNSLNAGESYVGKSFVFGGNYYKLVVYAIPYNTSGVYDEGHKVTLYENESLSSFNGYITADKINYDINIADMNDAKFQVDAGGLETGISGDNYYISVVPTSTDEYFVMKDGIYNVTLKDDDGHKVCTINSSDTDVKDDCYSIVIADKNNKEAKKFVFNKLKPNSLYHLEISYDTYYQNNVILSKDKMRTVQAFSTFTYTPVNNNITLGSITARMTTAKSITLTYNGSAHLSSNIGAVSYTIKEDGTNSIVNGILSSGGIYDGEVIPGNMDKIFTFKDNQTIPRIVIDVSNVEDKAKLSDNINFTFKDGKTYIITTQYFYYLKDSSGNYVMENGNKKLDLLKDLDGKGTYTTILNT